VVENLFATFDRHDRLKVDIIIMLLTIFCHILIKGNKLSHILIRKHQLESNRWWYIYKI